MSNSMKRTIDNVIKCKTCYEEMKYVSCLDAQIQKGECLACYLHSSQGYPRYINYVGDKNSN